MTDQTIHEPHEQPGATPPRPGWRQVPVYRIDKDDDEGVHIAGVVAGISRAYGFDLRSTRIAVAIATLVLPVLLLVYLAAWVLLPDSPETAVPLEDLVRDRRRLPVMLAIGLVLVVGSLGSFGAWFFFRGAPWGLGLIAIGILLWVSNGLGRRSPAAPPAVVAAPEMSGDTTDTTPTAAMPTATSAVRATFAPPIVVARPPKVKIRRRRWPIATISVAVAAVYIAVVSIFEAAGAWQAPALWVIVSALGIVAVGLVVSAIVNHSWLVLFPLIAVAGTITMLCIAQPRLDGGVGERSIVPLSTAAAERPQRLAAGQLEIDLRALPVGEDVTVTAEVGMGRLHVIVPRDALLVLDTELGAGALEVDDDEIVAGIRQDDTRVVQPQTAIATRTIVLDLRMGMGQIDVERSD